MRLSTVCRVASSVVAMVVDSAADLVAVLVVVMAAELVAGSAAVLVVELDLPTSADRQTIFGD